MSHALYIDPIAHAWRHCNPHAPLPSVLVQRAPQFDLALSLYSSQRKEVAECSGTAQDARNGLLAIAILPQIVLPDASE